MNHKLTHYQGVMEVKLNHEQDRNKDLPKKQTSKREKVKTFSRKSRRNLFKYILKLENREGFYFITLTYPKRIPRKLRNMEKATASALLFSQVPLPRNGFFVEIRVPEERCSPFSFVSVRPYYPPIQEIKKLIKDTWYRIVSIKSKGFRHWGTDVKEVNDIRSSGFYLAMYQCKDQNHRTDIQTGRIWGIYGRKMMPMSAQGTERLTEYNYKLLKRICRRWVAKQPNSRGYANYLKSRVGSFQIFMPNHEQVRFELDRFQTSIWTHQSNNLNSNYFIKE